MIVNVYIPDHAGHLLKRIKGICDQQHRSLSYIVREALEAYVASNAKTSPARKSADRLTRMKI